MRVPGAQHFLTAIARWGLLATADRALLARLQLPDAGHGYDPFGLCRDGVSRGLWLTHFAYHAYFRVTGHGHQHVPRTGAALLAANHSGTLPFDALMIWADVVRGVERVPRPLADAFVPGLPFVWSWFARAGAISGARGNVERMLATGELALVFPEGVPGIGKPFSERYRLRSFRVGHAELAIEHGVPVIPVAVIGAEEQLPLVTKLPRIGRLLGLPYLPVPAVPLPLPVHYHLYYGAPIDLRAEFGPDADDPAIAQRAAARVQSAVASLIERGLSERRGVFQ